MIDLVIVQCDGGFLPDILLLTHGPTVVWFDGTIVLVYYYIVSRPCMLKMPGGQVIS